MRLNSANTVAARSLVCAKAGNLSDVAGELLSRPLPAASFRGPSAAGVGRIKEGAGALEVLIDLDDLPHSHPWRSLRRQPAFVPRSLVVKHAFVSHEENVKFFQFDWYGRPVHLAVDDRAYDWSRFACQMLWAEHIVEALRVEVAARTGDSASPVRFVDVGCGSGWLSVLLKAAFPQPWVRVYCTDLSADALELAHENALANGVEIGLLHGSELEELCAWSPGSDTCGARFGEVAIDWVFMYPPQIEASPALELEAGLGPSVARIYGSAHGLASDVFVEDRLRHFRSILPQLRAVLRTGGRALFGVDKENMEDVLGLLQGAPGVASVSTVWDAEDDDHLFRHPCPSSVVETRFTRPAVA